MLLLAVLTLNLSGCGLDERLDDLTGGYEGAFIDKLTGEKVATEYYGAKLKLLDLEYGDVAAIGNIDVAAMIAKQRVISDRRVITQYRQ